MTYCAQHAKGLGAAALPNPINRPEISAATDLVAWLSTNGCTRQSVPVINAFQVAYNASGLPGYLTPDGQYGGNTEKALQNVMDEAQNDAGAGPSQQAPANCFGMAVPRTPMADPTPPPTPPGPGPTPNPLPVPTPAPSDGGWAPWLIGLTVAAGAGGIYYAYWRKHHRRGR